MARTALGVKRTILAASAALAAAAAIPIELPSCAGPIATRPVWRDVQVEHLVAVWIWAYSEGVSSAREIQRQADYPPELQWLCGMEAVNHHTLSDFRVAHGAALEQIFSAVLAVLSNAELIDLEQLAVDGTRVRSQGATSAERSRNILNKRARWSRNWPRRPTTKRPTNDAQRRAAREKLERMTQALEQISQVGAGKQDKKQVAEARGSETEPEARRQHESNGGWASGYNAQFATDAKAKIVVGVELTNNASDAQQLVPTLADVEQRMEQKPRQVLADSGSNSRANIAAMQEAEMEYATPVPRADKRSTGAARVAGIQAGFQEARADIPAIPGTKCGLQSV